jgi:hypothetical protein
VVRKIISGIILKEMIPLSSGNSCKLLRIRNDFISEKAWLYLVLTGKISCRHLVCGKTMHRGCPVERR